MLYIILGQVTSMSLDLTVGGEKKTDNNVNAKLGDQIVIKCKYEGIVALPWVASLNYQSSPGSESKYVFVFGQDLQAPWTDEDYTVENVYVDPKYSGLTIKSKYNT